MRVNWRKLIGWREKSPELATPGRLGTDSRMPESAGDRERGKFRESANPRLTLVGVANDDGTPVTAKTEEVLERIDDKLGQLIKLLSSLRDDYQV